MAETGITSGKEPVQSTAQKPEAVVNGSASKFAETMVEQPANGVPEAQKQVPPAGPVTIPVIDEDDAAAQKSKQQIERWLASMIIPDEYIQKAKEEEKELLRIQQQKQLEAFEALRKYCKEGSLQVQSKKGILYVASEEEQNKWLKIQMILDPATKKPTEFIGLHRSLTNRKDLTIKDARSMMGLAKMKGWTTVKLHGNKAEKNMLWLTAMESGLQVDLEGFVPDDKTQKMWQEMQASKAEAGISMPTEKAPEPAKDQDKKPTETAASKPAEPEKPAAASAEKTPEKPAETPKAEHQSSASKFADSPFKAPTAEKKPLPQPFKTPKKQPTL